MWKQWIGKTATYWYKSCRYCAGIVVALPANHGYPSQFVFNKGPPLAPLGGSETTTLEKSKSRWNQKMGRVWTNSRSLASPLRLPLHESLSSVHNFVPGSTALSIICCRWRPTHATTLQHEIRRFCSFLCITFASPGCFERSIYHVVYSQDLHFLGLFQTNEISIKVSLVVRTVRTPKIGATVV